MRTDFFIENDSHGMSLLDASMVDRVIAAGLGNDSQFVRDHEAILGLLVGDDSFIARVIVDEPLSKPEQDEWIAHYRSALSVPSGKLLVCGGFDPDILGWWRDNLHGRKGVKDVAVTPGKYLVDVYTYVHSMNGRMILSEVLEEKLGKWFRQDHAGRAFPGWVAGELAMFPDDDPGHEKEWKKLPESVSGGALKVEMKPLDWVSYLFHLQSFDPKAELTEPEEGSWFAPAQGLRKPARFPLGLPSDAEDPEYREALAALLPKKPEPPPQPIEVFPNVQQLTLRPITGGPVAVPLAAVARVYRLAWFTTSFVHPELRLEGPGVKDLAQYFPAPALPAVVGDALHVRYEGGAGLAPLSRLRKLGAEPWKHVPAGTVLELVTRPLQGGDEATGGPGFQRYRGTIKEGIWTISEAFPVISADALRRALALSEASESEDRLVLRSPEEAQRVLDAFRSRGTAMYPWITLSRKGAELRLSQADEGTIQFIALAGFISIFSSVWPCEVPELPEEDEEGGG